MPEVEEFLYCNFCDFDTNSNEELKKHTDILHGQDTEPSVPEDGKLRSIQNLNTDVQDVDNEVGISETKNLLVEQPIICGECGKGFIEESKFTYHMATHVTLLDIKCEKCDFVTTNKEEIKVHMQTTHSDIKVDLRIEDQNVIICDESNVDLISSIKTIRRTNIKEMENMNAKNVTIQQVSLVNPGSILSMSTSILILILCQKNRKTLF